MVTEIISNPIAKSMDLQAVINILHVKVNDKMMNNYWLWERVMRIKSLLSKRTWQHGLGLQLQPYDFWTTVLWTIWRCLVTQNHVWWKLNKVYNEKCLNTSVRHSCRTVINWAYFAATESEHLVVIDLELSFTPRYSTIKCEPICLTSKVWLEWPTQSLKLNLINHLWYHAAFK